MTSLSPGLDVRTDDEVLYLTLNRPDRRNALSDDILDALLAATDDLPASLRAIVIRGAGEVFCAGGDITQFKANLQGGDPGEIAAYNRRFGTFLARLRGVGAPVIAAVQGAAMGGGMGLAAAADITIANPGVRFSLTETTLGLPPAQICAFVVSRIGATAARRLMLTAALFDTADAHRLGLIDEVAGDLDDAVAAVLAQIRRCGPRANAATKALIDRCLHDPLPQVLDSAAADFAAAMLGDEAREGVCAFLERRSPAWNQ